MDREPPRTLGREVADLLTTMSVKDAVGRDHYELCGWIQAVIDRRFPPDTQQADKAASALREAIRLFYDPATKTATDYDRHKAVRDALEALPLPSRKYRLRV